MQEKRIAQLQHAIAGSIEYMQNIYAYDSSAIRVNLENIAGYIPKKYLYNPNERYSLLTEEKTLLAVDITSIEEEFEDFL